MKPHETESARMIEPLAVPATRKPGLKNEVLSIRMNDRVMEYLEGELAKMGIASARDKQNFYRGAILAGLSNAKRANSPAWKKFVAAVQPLAQKHLGMGLDLDGPAEYVQSGGLD